MKILYLLSCFIIVQSCSNSQLGKKLANSFDSSETLSSLSIETTNTRINKDDLTIENNEKSNSLVKQISTKNKKTYNISKEKPSLSKTNKNKKVKATFNRKKTFKPQPYRIIIRLSGADPSAPSESVTNVLIEAGVDFEIEKIERIDQRSSIKDLSKRSFL
ncbi:MULTISPECIES: hypothetical protein [unclassified Prochlorococcus]|nr:MULTISPECIES: hypothetical protein [unclassified Prochlorococcus]KGG16524.1 hypothetical protein EV06_0365 [Prochlorococcus sp. MIT 0602]